MSTSNAAFSAVKTAADSAPGTPDITCNQDQRTHPKVALASALLYARDPSAFASYRSKAINLIEAARATARDCGNAILSLGRQLGAYVLAADYVGYRDASFVQWVSSIRFTSYPSSHGLWKVLANTSRVTSNNWGTFALASMSVADAYLRDSAGLDKDYAVWRDYGDLGTSTFVHTSDFNTRGAAWVCPAGYEINPASCTDPKREGAGVEDAARTSYPNIANYPAETAQGYVITAEILAKQGYAAWSSNDRQACRHAAWRGRVSDTSGKLSLNWSSADYYVTWITNKRCGMSQPTQAAVFGRIFGFTDWLYGS